MSQIYREVHYHDHDHKHHIATALSALVGIFGGLIILLLGVRFILSYMEVDRLQPFTSFIYNASFPFVAPFFSLFNYQPQMGVMRIEFQTLIAIAFWGLATWFIARAFSYRDDLEQ